MIKGISHYCLFQHSPADDVGSANRHLKRNYYPLYVDCVSKHSDATTPRVLSTDEPRKVTLHYVRGALRREGQSHIHHLNQITVS